MANIIFTNKCNINCPFCFANENKEKSNQDNALNFTVADTWQVSNLLSSNLFKFCGGEPTLNPEIIPAITSLLKSDKNISILSNGLWPETFQDFIENLTLPYTIKIIYLFNILEPQFYTANQLQRLKKTLSIVNPVQTTLGITIYKKDFEYQYLFDLCQQYKINRIRWSICAPNTNGNDYLLEKDFYTIASRLYQFLKAAEKLNIKTTRDCGYIPPCFFKKNELHDLVLRCNGNINFTCTTSAIDIDKQKKAWRCYGLYSVLQVDIEQFKNEVELQKYFNRRMRLLDNLDNYKECQTCGYAGKSCGKGCYAIRIKKALQARPDICLFPVDDDKEVLNCCPVKNDEMLIRCKNGRIQLLFRNKAFENPSKEMLAILTNSDGKTTIKNIIDKVKPEYGNPAEAKTTIINSFRKIFEMDLITVNYDYKIEYKKRPLPFVDK